MIEQYFAIGDLAKRLGISTEKTRLLVKDEPGVLKFPRDSAKSKGTATNAAFNSIGYARLHTRLRPTYEIAVLTVGST
jgi:hypothetical protein